MQKRNILFLSSWYPNRITPTHGNFVHQHAIAAAKRNNVRLLYVCLDHSITQEDRVVKDLPFPISITYIPKSNVLILGVIWNYFRMIRMYFRLYRELQANGFEADLIHANVVYPIGIVARLLSLKYKIPYLISEHWTCYSAETQQKPSVIQMTLLRWAAKKAERILPVSKDLASAMKSVGIQTEMTVLYNVIDTDLFIPKEKELDGKIHLVHISSLDEIQKNPALLFQVVAELKKTHPTVQLDIVSDGEFSPYLNLIRSLDIENHIAFHGMQEAKGVARILQQGHLFVLTSRFENLPCVLLESMSCGVPVVSTNVGGIKEIIHSKNGILVPAEDKVSLVNAINSMLLRLVDYHPQGMHDEALNLFSYEAIGIKLSEVYESILSENA